VVTAIVGGFSFCAISTSFIGSAIGLSEFIQPRLEKWAAGRGLYSSIFQLYLSRFLSLNPPTGTAYSPKRACVEPKCGPA
jgi:hypothetical protein